MDRALRLRSRAGPFLRLCHRGLRYEGLLKAFSTIDVPEMQAARQVLRLRRDGFDKSPRTTTSSRRTSWWIRTEKISLIDWEYAGMSFMAADRHNDRVHCGDDPRSARPPPSVPGRPLERRRASSYEVFMAGAGTCGRWSGPMATSAEWLTATTPATRTLDSLLAAYEAASRHRLRRLARKLSTEASYGFFSGALWGPGHGRAGDCTG